MKWIKYIRGLVLGVGLIVVPLTQLGFGSTTAALVTSVFIVVGISLIALISWVAILEYQRFQRAERLASTPVAEPEGAGMGFLRRERAERERAEREQAEDEQARREQVELG
jgi:hypothetical protein